jgi:hypothetical protein
VSQKVPKYQNKHRVYRVPGFLSVARNPAHSFIHKGECAPPPFGSKGETHSLSGEGGGTQTSLSSLFVFLFSVRKVGTEKMPQNLHRVHIKGHYLNTIYRNYPSQLRNNLEPEGLKQSKTA